ncbi:MAG: carbon starvation protein A [Lentisphaerae bacterium]|nr:carbon starvation protein A [Lentisphaerota bacterium]
MSLLPVVLISAVVLFLAYRGYGGLLSRLFRLDRNAETPAVRLRDDVDYVPIEPKFLFGQHFSAIAAAGPIVGPILAGVMFGWLPALLWILIGSIFIGGVHDMGSLVASIRHRARSIAEVVREHMNRRSYVLFLIFIWITLVYIIAAFTDIVASSFVGRQTLEDGTVISGGGIATSSLLYLVLPIVMGLLLRTTRLSLRWATVIFLPLVGVAIWAGPLMPFDLATLLGVDDATAIKIWDVILLVYCVIAATVPMWLLLQPRGHLGGYFLLVALIGGALGILFGGKSIQYPAFIGWSTADGQDLFPILFITIACGACSGFHALVSSGTSSRQLRLETDAKPIGYGAMLMEAMVAVVSLGCVMMLAPDHSAVAGGSPKANLIYGLGMGSFLQVIGVPSTFAVSFALLAFTTFVYDTLDVGTRLGRYILQELTGWQGPCGRWVATILTTGLPLLMMMQRLEDAAGRPLPAWRMLWPLFGSCNQLLAALALLGVTVWLYRTRRAAWVWPVAGLPALWMYLVSIWALLGFVRRGFFTPSGSFVAFPASALPWAALVLILLGLLLLAEAVPVLWRATRQAAEAAPATP